MFAGRVGRWLLRSGVVHPRNGVKADNAPGYQALGYQALGYQRIEDLELFESAKDLATERQRRNPHPGYRRVELPGRGRRR